MNEREKPGVDAMSAAKLLTKYFYVRDREEVLAFHEEIAALLETHFRITQARSQTDEVKLLRDAIERALADEESGKGWGPDVTVCAYLRDALKRKD